MKSLEFRQVSFLCYPVNGDDPVSGEDEASDDGLDGVDEGGHG